MKKVLFLLAVLLFVLPLSARQKLEISPRLSLHNNDALFDGVRWSIGGDIIFNPAENIGFRVNMAELFFGDPTILSMNMNVLYFYSNNIDFLYYMNIAGLSSYVAINFGLISVAGSSFVVTGGGLGLEQRIGKRNCIFLEPALTLMNGEGASEVIFEVSGGLKLGI